MYSAQWAMEADKFLGKAKQIDHEPNDGLWFKHMSPVALDELRPLTYPELEAVRPGYNIFERRKTELLYHDLLSLDKESSFLYAAIVGLNKMEAPDSYPGFTYYFRLNPAQISQCIFTIVDKKTWKTPHQAWMKPTKGISGLDIAKGIWVKHGNTFIPYEEEELGVVDPRIEVVIPFAVTPEFYFPQEEDRK